MSVYTRHSIKNDGGSIWVCLKNMTSSPNRNVHVKGAKHAFPTTKLETNSLGEPDDVDLFECYKKKKRITVKCSAFPNLVFFYHMKNMVSTFYFAKPYFINFVGQGMYFKKTKGKGGRDDHYNKNQKKKEGMLL